MSRPSSSRSERGVALLAALAFVLMTSMLIGAGLVISSTHYSKAWAEARSESALLLADGGIDDEIALLAEGIGAPIPSAPVVASGETSVFPGEGHAVYGRKGSPTGTSDEAYWVCTSANEWWCSGATPQVWDGLAGTFWITASAFVKGSWRRAEVQVSKVSVFGRYALYTNGGDDACTSSGVSVGASASVAITGLSGTNGKVTRGSGANLSTGTCVNANKRNCASAQYPDATLRSGEALDERNAPYAYPTTTSVLKRYLGLTGVGDAAAWASLKSTNDNANGIYTYRSGATSASIAVANCAKAGFSGTTLRNFSSSSSTSEGAWDYARVRPGTGSKVKTLIFEPGDYYFSSVQLPYDDGTEIIVDPQAYASGGTPGQIRFWIYDPASGATDDSVSQLIYTTVASGATSVDPSLVRFYYAKDGNSLTFNRPAGIKDYRGYTLVGDYVFFGGVYAVTRTANTVGCSTNVGASIKMVGSTGSTNGKCRFTGSMVCDMIAFTGPCGVDFADASGPSDPAAGAKIVGGYADGR